MKAIMVCPVCGKAPVVKVFGDLPTRQEYFVCCVCDNEFKNGQVALRKTRKT